MKHDRFRLIPSPSSLIAATFLLVVAFFGVSCAKTMTIYSNEKAKVNLISSGQTPNDGEMIGETPLTFPLDKLSGKYLKVSTADSMPQLILISDVLGSETQVSIKLEKIERSEDEKDKDKKDEEKKKGKEAEGKDGKKPDEDGKKSIALNDVNKYVRIVLRSYQSLAAGNLAAAKENAEQLLQLNPELAGPHIIIGLSRLKESDKAGAIASFQKAKNLDPEDKDLDKLIEFSQ